MGELKAGDKITVRYSKRLERNGNAFLANRSGVVTRVVMSGGRIAGVFADIKMVKRARNYYIPICSVDGSDDINRLRTLGILKSTIL